MLLESLELVQQNGVYRKQVRLYPRAMFFDTWRYSGSEGSYTAFFTDKDGKHIEARAGDGIHFTGAGEDYLARLMFGQIRYEFLGRGTGPS